MDNHLTADALNDTSVQSKLNELRKSATCTICLDYFDNPYALPCSHCFCSKCINAHLNGNRNAYCPVCKTPATLDSVTFDNAVDQLAKAVRKFVEALDGNNQDESSHVGAGEASSSSSAQGNLFFIDDLVEVTARTWPGSNKLGGVGRVVRINRGDEITYDIRYVLDKTLDAAVPPLFIAHMGSSGEVSDDVGTGRGGRATRATRGSQGGSTARSTTPSSSGRRRSRDAASTASTPVSLSSPGSEKCTFSTPAAATASAPGSGHEAAGTTSETRKRRLPPASSSDKKARVQCDDATQVGRGCESDGNVAAAADDTVNFTDAAAVGTTAGAGTGTGGGTVVEKVVVQAKVSYKMVLSSTSLNSEKDKAVLAQFCARFVTNHAPLVPSTAAASASTTAAAAALVVAGAESGTEVRYCDNFDPSVTHLVISTLPLPKPKSKSEAGGDSEYICEKRTMKYMRAVASGCWVLSVAWMEQSLAADRVIIPSRFAGVDGGCVMEDFEVCRFAKCWVRNAPRRARLSVEATTGLDRAAAEPGVATELFADISGCMVYGQFPHPLPSRADLTLLLEAGGARIVRGMAIGEVVKACVQSASVFGSSIGGNVNVASLQAPDAVGVCDSGNSNSTAVRQFLTPRIVIVCPDAAAIDACRAEFNRGLREALHMKPAPTDGSVPRDSVSVSSKLQLYNRMIVITTYVWLLDSVANYELRAPTR